MDNLKIDTSSPVLVTGATGYIAGVLIKLLLDHGLTVHATVRDPSKTDRLDYLIKAAEESPGQIKFFKGNLLEAGSFTEAMKNCSIVFHTASPFAFKVDDPQADLIDPAVKGTELVLQTVNKTPSVKKVVLTSSVVAIFTDATETQQAPNQVLNEDVWNETATLDYQPYFLSKTLAEKKAWEMFKNNNPNNYKLVAMNPALVMGPGLKYHASSESFETLEQMGCGQFAYGVPNLRTGIVDVRDVATAHLIAAFREDVEGRHLLCSENSSFVDIADALRKKYSDYPISTCRVPKFLLLLFGSWVDPRLSYRLVQNNCDVNLNIDNTKSIEKLGMKYRTVEDTVQDMFEQIVKGKEEEKNNMK